MESNSSNKNATKLNVPSGADQPTSNDDAVAFDAMAILADEFTLRPDFGHLLDLAVRTMGRQFLVDDAFIAIFEFRSPNHDKIHFTATGRFVNDPRVKAAVHQLARDTSLETGDIVDLTAVNSRSTTLQGFDGLKKSGVRTLVFLSARQKPVGIVGLASKSDGSNLASTDLRLLRILAKSITPILVNAHVFGEVNSVRSWYASILNNVRQGVFVFDEKFHLKMANIAGLRILESYLGNEPETRGWTGLHITDIFVSEKFPGWSDRIEAIGIIADISRPFQLIAKSNKERRVFTAHIASCSDWTTEELDVIVTVEDITAQKENESRLMNLERLADKGLMSSAIAHELNNFLGLILGGIDISLAAVEHDDIDKQRDRLEKLKEHAMTMRRFTAGLIDKHQLDTQLAFAQLNDVVTDVVAFVQVQKRFRNVNISCHLSKRLPRIELDVNQISQLLLNFLNNAADAIRDAERENGCITIKTDLKRSQVQISIADNGGGIREELQGKLFRENFTTKDSGHGYGLTTCKAILDKHRAHVDVESVAGRGTTFRMFFPVETIDSSAD